MPLSFVLVLNKYSFNLYLLTLLLPFLSDYLGNAKTIGPFASWAIDPQPLSGYGCGWNSLCNSLIAGHFVSALGKNSPRVVLNKVFFPSSPKHPAGFVTPVNLQKL